MGFIWVLWGFKNFFNLELPNLNCLEGKLYLFE